MTHGNFWTYLSRWTRARIDQDKKDGTLKTKDLLNFHLDWAKAKDALETPFDPFELQEQLKKFLSENQISILTTQATDLSTYLKRPDLGRKLSLESANLLKNRHKKAEQVVILTQGLSALALDKSGSNFLKEFLRLCGPSWLIFIVPFGRVGLSDDLGQILQTRHLFMALGERPGLSCFDSMGVYYTFEPRVGKDDSCRNCISNIHGHGLSPQEGARQAWQLWQAAEGIGQSGVHLKLDELISIC